MSALDKISSVDLFEALITNDPRWTWILDDWEASCDENMLNLAQTVHRFRANFTEEMAGLISKLLGDIKGPGDMKSVVQEGVDAPDMEPEPECLSDTD